MRFVLGVIKGPVGGLHFLKVHIHYTEPTGADGTGRESISREIAGLFLTTETRSAIEGSDSSCWTIHVAAAVSVTGVDLEIAFAKVVALHFSGVNLWDSTRLLVLCLICGGFCGGS